MTDPDRSLAALLAEIEQKLEQITPGEWGCPPELQAAWGNDTPWYALHSRSRADAELIAAAPRLLAAAARVIRAGLVARSETEEEEKR
jgi:hypothetical protein